MRIIDAETVVLETDEEAKAAEALVRATPPNDSCFPNQPSRVIPKLIEMFGPRALNA